MVDRCVCLTRVVGMRWWGSRRQGRDAGVTSGDRTFVGFGSESGRARSCGWGTRDGGVETVLSPRVGGLNRCWLVGGQRGAKGGARERWQVAVLETDVELARGMGSRAGWARSSGWRTQTLVLCGNELRDGFGCRDEMTKMSGCRCPVRQGSGCATNV